jgi:hypothetical protein
MTMMGGIWCPLVAPSSRSAAFNATPSMCGIIISAVGLLSLAGGLFAMIAFRRMTLTPD